MAGVKVVNETEHDIILQEGSKGIFTPLGTIRKGQVYSLKVDVNDTYREYRCKLSYEISQRGQAVALSSDDFADYEEITIKWDKESDTLSYVPKKREPGSNAAADKSSPGLARRFLYKLGLKKWLAPTDGGGGADGDGRRGGGSGAADVP